MTYEEAKKEIVKKWGKKDWVDLTIWALSDHSLYDHEKEAAELYARSKCLEFKEWYDKLTPADKCTVWPPADSGSGHGLYNQTDQDIVQKFFKLFGH